MNKVSADLASGFAVAPLGRIIRATEAKLYDDAQSALAAARASAISIIAQAEAEARAIRAAARQAGHDDASAEIAMRHAETAASIQASLDAVAGEITSAIAEAVGRIIGAFELGEIMPRIARLAVMELRNRHGVVLRVAPGNAEAAVAACADLPGLRVEADAALAPDDCVIITDSGTIQAGLERQIAALRAALLR